MKSYEAKSLIARHEESVAILQGIIALHRKADVARNNIAVWKALFNYSRVEEESRLDTIQAAIIRLEQRYHKSIHKIITK